MLANAPEIVHQLYAIRGSEIAARIGQALVNIAFASGADESGRAFAFVSADLIDAGSVIVASAAFAIVFVYLAQHSHRTCAIQSAR